jgi:hypothetical protein
VGGSTFREKFGYPPPRNPLGLVFDLGPPPPARASGSAGMREAAPSDHIKHEVAIRPDLR